MSGDRIRLLAQVFYHLGELDDALTYALGANQLFDINENSEYVQTLLGKCGPCLFLEDYFLSLLHFVECLNIGVQLAVWTSMWSCAPKQPTPAKASPLTHDWKPSCSACSRGQPKPSHQDLQHRCAAP